MLPRSSQLGAASLYAQRAALIRRVLGANALAAYDRLENYSEIDPFLDRVVGLSVAAQRALVSTLAAYLRVATDQRFDELDLDEVTGDAIRPDGMRHSWSIPFFALWGALGAGVVFATAWASTRALVDVQARTDLAFAQSAAMTRYTQGLTGVTRYRRVLVGEGCQFCTLAAEHTYGTDELMPLHPGCNCAVAPIIGGVDPASDLNATTMAA